MVLLKLRIQFASRLYARISQNLMVLINRKAIYQQTLCKDFPKLNGAAQIARRFISRPYARISQIFDLEKATALIWRKLLL